MQCFYCCQPTCALEKAPKVTWARGGEWASRVCVYVWGCVWRTTCEVQYGKKLTFYGFAGYAESISEFRVLQDAEQQQQQHFCSFHLELLTAKYRTRKWHWTRRRREAGPRRYWTFNQLDVTPASCGRSNLCFTIYRIFKIKKRTSLTNPFKSFIFWKLFVENYYWIFVCFFLYIVPGISSLASCGEVESLPELPPQDEARLQRAARVLQQRLILRQWLADHGLQSYYQK